MNITKRVPAPLILATLIVIAIWMTIIGWVIAVVLALAIAFVLVIVDGHDNVWGDCSDFVVTHTVMLIAAAVCLVEFIERVNGLSYWYGINPVEVQRAIWWAMHNTLNAVFICEAAIIAIMIGESVLYRQFEDREG